MKWTRGTKNSDVVDARGARGRTPVVAGGGIAVAVVVFLVAKFVGVDISGLLGGGSSGPSSSTSATSSTSSPGSGAPRPDDEAFEFVSFVLKDIQDTFEGMYRAQGKTYARAKLTVFTSEVATACGVSSSAIGPFYCPGDQHAYIDLSFYQDLKARFGAPGDFAQAYVLAHEIGHHLQNLMDVGPSRTNAHSVKVELQADCFAGIWAKAAQGKGLLEVGDIEEALTAASAIGDDRLQKQAGVEVKPESFTHGTSAQRVRWFRRGLEVGQFEACDTYSAPSL